MKPSELLHKGAEEIKRRGWVRDWFGADPDEPDTCAVCAVGALRAAMTGDPFVSDITDPVFGEARGWLLEAIGGNSIVNWNDSSARSAAEVLGKLTYAAELAEADGR